MPVNTIGTIADQVHVGTIANLSAASIDYLPVARAGRLVGGGCAQSAATTVAPAVVTVRKFPGWRRGRHGGLRHHHGDPYRLRRSAPSVRWCSPARRPTVPLPPAIRW